MMKRRPTLFFLLLFGVPALVMALALALALDLDGILAWLAAINLATFLLFGFDKWKARAQGFRVSEFALHLFAFLGGVPAASLGMALFRHKTRKPFFTILYIVFLIIHLAIAWRFLVLGGEEG